MAVNDLWRLAMIHADKERILMPLANNGIRIGSSTLAFTSKTLTGGRCGHG